MANSGPFSPEVSRVLDVVSEQTGFSVGDMVSYNRARPVATARAAAMWTLSRHLNLTDQQVGLVLNGRHPSTVVSSLQLVEGLITINDPICDVLREINNALRPPCHVPLQPHEAIHGTPERSN